MAQTIEQIVRARVVVTGEQKLDALNRKLKALKQNAGEFGKTFGSAFRDATRGMQQIERGTQAMRREMARARSDIDATARSFGTMRAEAERARAAVRDIGRAGGGGGGLGAMARQASAIRRDMQAAATASARAGRGGGSGGPRDQGTPRRPPGLSTARTATGFDGPGAATRTRTQAASFDASADRIVSALNQVSSRLERATSATDRQQRGTQTHPTGGGLPLAIGTRDPGAAQAALATMAAARSIAQMGERIRAMAGTAGVTLTGARAGATTASGFKAIAEDFEKAMRGSRRDLKELINKVNKNGAYGLGYQERNKIVADLAGRNTVSGKVGRANAITEAYDKIHGGATPRRGTRTRGVSSWGSYDLERMLRSAGLFIETGGIGRSINRAGGRIQKWRENLFGDGGARERANERIRIGAENMRRQDEARAQRGRDAQSMLFDLGREKRRRQREERAARKEWVEGKMAADPIFGRFDTLKGAHNARMLAAVRSANARSDLDKMQSTAQPNRSSYWAAQLQRDAMMAAYNGRLNPSQESVSRMPPTAPSMSPQQAASIRAERAAAQANRDAMMSDARMRAIAMGGADPATISGHRGGPPPLPMARGVTGGAASAALIRAAASLDRAAAALTRAAMALAGGRGGQRGGSYIGPSGPDLHGTLRSRAALDALSGRHEAMRGQNNRNRAQVTLREYRRLADNFTKFLPAKGGGSMDMLRRIGELNQYAQRLIAHRVANKLGVPNRPTPAGAMDFLRGLERDAFRRRSGGGSTLASGLGGMERYLPTWLGGPARGAAPQRVAPPPASAGAPNAAANGAFFDHAMTRRRGLNRASAALGGAPPGGGGGGGITGLGGLGDMAAGGAMARFFGRSSTGLGLRQVGAFMGIASLGAGAAQGVRTFANFEAKDIEQRGLGKYAGYSPTNLADLSRQARDLAAATIFTPNDVLSAQITAMKAGRTHSEVKTATPSALNLAAVAGMTVDDAMNTVLNIMAQGQVPASKLAGTTDDLVATFLSSKADLKELGVSAKYAMPVLTNYGFGTREQLAILGALSEGGLQGSIGGRGIAQGMTNLARMNPKRKKLAKSFGFDIDDHVKNGKVADPNGMFQALFAADKKAEGKLLPQLFDSNAQRALLTLREMGDVFDRIMGSFDKYRGSAQELADKKMEGVSGALKNLQSQAEEFAITIGLLGAGGAIDTALRAFGNALGDVSKSLNGQNTGGSTVGQIADLVNNPGLTAALIGDKKYQDLSRAQTDLDYRINAETDRMKVAAMTKEREAIAKQLEERRQVVKQMVQNKNQFGGDYRTADDQAPVPVKVVPTTNEEPWWQRNAPSRWFGDDAQKVDKWGVPFDLSKTSKEEIERLSREMNKGEEKFDDPVAAAARRRLHDRWAEMEKLERLSPGVPLNGSPTGRTIWDRVNPFPPAHAGELPPDQRRRDPGDGSATGGAGAIATAADQVMILGNAATTAAGAINGLASAASAAAGAVGQIAAAAGAAAGAANGRLVAREAPSGSGGAAP